MTNYFPQKTLPAASYYLPFISQSATVMYTSNQIKCKTLQIRFCDCFLAYIMPPDTVYMVVLYMTLKSSILNCFAKLQSYSMLQNFFMECNIMSKNFLLFM